MAIPESQFETWSHQGSISQSAGTYETIRNALRDPKAPFASKNFDIFLQGSYGNSTNIYADSDVDIVICLSSTYYSDTSGLSAPEKALFESKRSPASYGFREFKNEVLAWLRFKFGSTVSEGKKAIAIPSNGSRRDADVLVCAEHHRYTKFPTHGSPSLHKGIVFWTTDGKEIINFPKQHLANCSAKHQACSLRFKPNVRVLKNIRRAMVSKGFILAGEAPSYFLEGMLWNVPESQFQSTYQQTFLNSIVWLNECDPTKLTCANDLHWLIREGTDICWNTADFRKTKSGLWKLWESWS